MEAKIVLTIMIQIILCSSENNWPTIYENETRVESALEGSDVTLRCAGRVENMSAYWEYKLCGTWYNVSECSRAAESGEGWIEVGARGTHTGLLKLGPLTIQNQGLYRCRQSANSHIQLLSAVRLEVLPKTHDEDKLLPIFLDHLPKNLVVQKGYQAVFQCRVLSHSPTRLLWVAPGVDGSEHLHYMKQWYSILKASAAVWLPGGVHLSRLVLPNVRPSDSGRYFCIAVNTRGFTNSSAYLEVIDNESDKSMYLLFLLPLVVAVCPAIIWGCYSWRRARRQNRTEECALRTSRETLEIF